MKKNMIKSWILTLFACTATLTVVGCSQLGTSGSNSQNSNSSLTLKDATYDVAYGDIYKINTIVSDAEGHIFDMSYVVKDADGNVIKTAGDRFTVMEKEGYEITFSITINGTTYTKKDTLNILATGKPAINIDGKEVAVYLGESYTVPGANAFDVYDGAITPTIEIYKKTADGEVKCEYDGNGVFTPTTSGEYFVKATATNSGNTTGEARKTFYARAEMEDGEFENFDEACAILNYDVNNKLFGVFNGIEYHDSYKNKNGVLCFDLTRTENNTGIFNFYAKGNKADYEDYKYIAITAYIEGDEGCLACPKFSGSFKSELLQDVVYNAWKTYYIPAENLISNWKDTRENNNNANRITLSTAIPMACKVYFDRLYFANEATITGGCTETVESVTPNYACNGEIIDYTVYYNGELINLKNGSFKAPYAGDYEIYPVFLTGDVVHTGEPLIYTVNAPASLQLNDYDQVIDATTENYVLPEATLVNGDGYTLKTTMTFTNYLNKTSAVSSFDKMNKGEYTYTFTATKEGAKTLVATARVKSGARIEGEIFNVDDADAANRIIVQRFGSVAVISEGDENVNFPAGFSGKVVQLNWNNTLSSAWDTLAANIRPSATYEEIAQKDFVTVKIGIQGTLANGQSYPKTTLTFAGKAFTFTSNGVVSVRMTTAEFLKEYHKFSLNANVQYDYAIHVGTDISCFTDFNVYMANIVMENVTYAEGELFTAGKGVPLKGMNSSNKEQAGVKIDAADVPTGRSGNFERITATKTVSVASPLTLDEIIALKAAGYKTLNFSLYIVDDKDYLSIATNDGLLYRNNGNKTLTFTNKTWYDYQISIDTVIAEMQDSDTNELLILSKLKQFGADFDAVYVSDMIFSK